MQTSRVFAAALPACELANARDGTMASSSGSESETPKPLSAVRRESCLPVGIMDGRLLLVFLVVLGSLFSGRFEHFGARRAERRTVGHAQDQVGHAVLPDAGVAHD